MSSRLWISSVALSLAMAPFVLAQQAPAVPRPAERARESAEQVRENREAAREGRTEHRAAANRHKFENMDQFMVAWLVPGNEEEIILGKMAQDRAQNEEVKQFAGQIIQDHTRFLANLKKFGHVEATLSDTSAAREATGKDDANVIPPANREPSAPPAEGTVRETARDVGDAVRNVVGYTDAADACHIQREIHRECLELTKSELDQKQGAEFDKCYLGTQIGAHMGMLATLKTFERHASDEMRPTIQQARATTEQHLNHAKELMKQLDRPSTVRRPAAGVESQE